MAFIAGGAGGVSNHGAGAITTASAMHRTAHFLRAGASYRTHDDAIHSPSVSRMSHATIIQG